MWAHSSDESYEELEGEARGFLEGFSIAFFNPKIALFLVAVLAQVLESGMSLETKLVIGFIGMAIDMAWYVLVAVFLTCLLYTSPSPRDYAASRMPSSA